MKYRKAGSNGVYRNVETGIFVRPRYLSGHMTGDRVRWASHSVEGLYETRDALVRAYLKRGGIDNGS